MKANAKNPLPFEDCEKVSDGDPLYQAAYVFSNNDQIATVIKDDSVLALQKIPDNSFNVAVTSPPYYWARDYGFEKQIGHEDSVEDYIDALMRVFDEVHRVLHLEGIFFLNIGDTYYSGNGQPHGKDPKCSSRLFMRKKLRAVDRSGWDLPKKSLIGVPWRVALEMQKRGWTLRSDIIWNRVNAFVEPTARDRPHRQHEHVFMFSKSRFYSFDRSSLDEEDVWTIPIERNRSIKHNAPFPEELVRRCIVAASPEGGKVLDPFVGSGTTIFASLINKRHVVGIDLGEQFVDDIIDKLIKEGCKRSSWRNLIKTLSKQPQMWPAWEGNKENFRKPGTKNRNRSEK